MRVSTYNADDQRYDIFQGKMEIQLTPGTPNENGFLPFQQDSVKAVGTLERVGTDTVPYGVVVSNWEPPPNGIAEFLWQGASVMFWCWLFRKLVS